MKKTNENFFLIKNFITIFIISILTSILVNCGGGGGGVSSSSSATNDNFSSETSEGTYNSSITSNYNHIKDNEIHNSLGLMYNLSF